MRMLGTCIYMKVPVHLRTQAGLGEHLADGLPNYGFRLAGEKFLGGSETLTSGITGNHYPFLLDHVRVSRHCFVA